jgi:Flp pilus assembly protein TadG
MRKSVKNRIASADLPAGSLLRRLARDRAGNTLAMIAAAIMPMMALVGGGIDMGRAYLSQSRLQQACDAGVLAARKRLGTVAVTDGAIPAAVADTGARFFNINFRAGSYGTRQRDFALALENDNAISGTATVVVPTTIMQMFGYDQVPVLVSCQAELNVANTDVMLVLDTTGSMNDTNPGDTTSKIDALKATVRSFYAQMAQAAGSGTRVRYGFVPYSTNVNVGGLLADGWVVDTWTYQSRQRVLNPATGTYSWAYKPVTTDVRNWRTTSNGCMEERATYEITDYDTVDLSRALDLDLNTAPTPGDPATQWRPMYPAIEYARAMKWDGSGSFSPAPVTSTAEFVRPSDGGMAACPAAAKKLSVMTADQVDAYLANLKAAGSTYHDIGMIWGGRLISPTGPFAAENGDVSPSHRTNRNLIFLTDGLTAPLDLSYSSYGIEPIDGRRWSPSSGETLTSVVEKRFSVACQEVKKMNVTVWIIGFGTKLNPVMTQCAGEGHSFEAADAAQLEKTFSDIAKRMGELRISR